MIEESKIRTARVSGMTKNGIQVTRIYAYFYIKRVIEHENPLLCTRTILRMTKRAYQKFIRDE